jgi:beta-aspartyl-peptidase (threonine type)
MNTQKYSLVIHGGAGTIVGSEQELQAYKDSLTKIILSGKQMLAAGQSALEVVVACVKLLEDDPLYNAGKGSVFNNKAEVECDASIMDGSDISAAAVAGVTTIKNPITLAQKVLEESEHVMLIGSGAEYFADQYSDVKRVKNDYFYTSKRQEQLIKAQKENKSVLDHSDSLENKFGTVGAVAFDQNGNLAAATSTGGITNKKWGRVGDSPLIGCGTYADNTTCAVSCTGYGEQFIRTSLAKTISDLVWLTGSTAEHANKKAMEYLTKRVSGIGGAIVIDHSGQVSTNFTSPGMIQAAITSTCKKPTVNFEQAITITL